MIGKLLPHLTEVCQTNPAIISSKRKQSSIKNAELVWKISHSTPSNNKCEILYMFWFCTVLEFNYDRFYKFLSHCNPVDTANEFCILWELELSTKRGFNMDLTFIYFRRKSIIGKMHFVAIFLLFKVLGHTRICEGPDVNNFYMSCRGTDWRELQHSPYQYEDKKLLQQLVIVSIRKKNMNCCNSRL